MLQVLVAGGGMIVHDQILPSLYQLRRIGLIGEIAVCSRRASTLHGLASAETLLKAFPGQTFQPFADFENGGFEQALETLPPRNLVFVALPDHLHFGAILTALESSQHVICVKPLVLRVSESIRIAKEAAARELFVGVEYHKRFDDRSLMARRAYRDGRFGEFRLGSACLMEKWHYRHSNFQNWCTTENSDAFTYIGCHYVDLVRFITGLDPVAVSVHGVKDRFPNGGEGFLWTDARVLWSNGACLNVQNSLSLPDSAPGTNTQGLTLYCGASDGGAMLRHSDQYRGLEYADAATYSEPSPDYFQYVDLGQGGLTPLGYGYRSIEYLVRSVLRVESSTSRTAELQAIDREDIAATPVNSAYNDRVIEAGRESILNSGALVSYIGDSDRNAPLPHGRGSVTEPRA